MLNFLRPGNSENDVNLAELAESAPLVMDGCIEKGEFGGVELRYQYKALFEMREGIAGIWRSTREKAMKTEIGDVLRRLGSVLRRA